MKLVVAIIQDKYVDEVLKMSNSIGVRMTRLTSTGGFFKKGNTTFLIGLDDEVRNLFYDNVRKICSVVEENPNTDKVYGANMFVVGVDSSRKL